MTEKGKEVLQQEPLDSLAPGNPFQSHPHESTLRSITETRGQAKLDAMNFADKAVLTPEQSDILRNLETSILRGDLKFVATTLDKYKDNPDAAKPFMAVLVKDLREGGIDAMFDVNPVQDAPIPTGVFSMSTASPTDSKEYFKKEHTSVCFYTNSSLDTLAEHAYPTNHGLDSDSISPNAALDEISAKLAYGLLDKPQVIKHLSDIFPTLFQLLGHSEEPVLLKCSLRISPTDNK